jgi:DNA-directed RNA polymerase specialized sigma24 family protein
MTDPGSWSEPSATDWNDLLHRTQHGDRQAQNNLFTRLAVTLRPILQCRLRGWSKQEQDDVLQETLMTFAQKLPGLGSNPHYYACGILRHKIGDALRARRAHTNLSLDDSQHPSAPALQSEIQMILTQNSSEDEVTVQVENDEYLELISRAVKRLSQFCQAFFLGLLEHREIAEIWSDLHRLHSDLKPGTFRKRIFDCRMKLKEILQEQA